MSASEINKSNLSQEQKARLMIKLQNLGNSNEGRHKTELYYGKDKDKKKNEKK